MLRGIEPIWTQVLKAKALKHVKVGQNRQETMWVRYRSGGSPESTAVSPRGRGSIRAVDRHIDTRGGDASVAWKKKKKNVSRLYDIDNVHNVGGKSYSLALQMEMD